MYRDSVLDEFDCTDEYPSWPSFLENTADYRRAHRRREYGDESDPQIRAFLESISPINHADKITAPLSIAHGETDVRVTVQEAVEMFRIVSKRGYVELMVCENEGHGALILILRYFCLIH